MFPSVFTSSCLHRTALHSDLFLFTALTNFRCAHPKYRLLEVDKGTHQLICTKAVGQAFLLETTVIQTETWKKIWQSLDKAKDGRTSKLPFQTLPFSMIYDCVHASGRMINQDCFVHRYFFTHAHEARFVGGYFFAHLFACSHSSAHTHTRAHTLRTNPRTRVLSVAKWWTSSSILIPSIRNCFPKQTPEQELPTIEIQPAFVNFYACWQQRLHLKKRERKKKKVVSNVSVALPVQPGVHTSEITAGRFRQREITRRQRRANVQISTHKRDNWLTHPATHKHDNTSDAHSDTQIWRGRVASPRESAWPASRLLM